MNKCKVIYGTVFTVMSRLFFFLVFAAGLLINHYSKKLTCGYSQNDLNFYFIYIQGPEKGNNIKVRARFDSGTNY